MLEVWLCNPWAGWPYENSSERSPLTHCSAEAWLIPFLLLPWWSDWENLAMTSLHICFLYHPWVPWGQEPYFTTRQWTSWEQRLWSPLWPPLAPSQAQPWHTADIQGCGPLLPQPNSLCPSIPMTGLPLMPPQGGFLLPAVSNLLLVPLPLSIMAPF